jgi:hypothetical protein
MFELKEPILFMLFILDLKEPNNVYVVYFRSERDKQYKHDLDQVDLK